MGKEGGVFTGAHRPEALQTRWEHQHAGGNSGGTEDAVFTGALGDGDGQQEAGGRYHVQRRGFSSPERKGEGGRDFRKSN